MKTIPLVKYTSFGNNFVIVDETAGPFFTEMEKSTFAYHATNQEFGIGSDNFIIIQRCQYQNLDLINEYRRYWGRVPDSARAEYIFRMFEPDGTEAYSCANGLMCVMKHLNLAYQHSSISIMTEVPTPMPKTITAGIDAENRHTWINLGNPRKIPEDMADSEVRDHYNNAFEKLNCQTIRFRKHDLAPLYSKQKISISGYLVFTGEPHMVILIDENFPIPEFSDLLFIDSHFSPDTISVKNEKRAGYGTWLVQHIGHYFNFKLRNLFPKGINVNFVRVNPDRQSIEYRCFERGIFKETLSCGTGALASAFIANEMGYVTKDTITVLPYRCRCFDPEAKLIIQKTSSGWIIKGAPRLVLRGELMLSEWTGSKQSIEQDTNLPILSSQVEPGLYNYGYRN